MAPGEALGHQPALLDGRVLLDQGAKLIEAGKRIRAEDGIEVRKMALPQGIQPGDSSAVRIGPLRRKAT